MQVLLLSWLCIFPRPLLAGTGHYLPANPFHPSSLWLPSSQYLYFLPRNFVASFLFYSISSMRFPCPFHFLHRAGWFPWSIMRFFWWLYHSILFLQGKQNRMKQNRKIQISIKKKRECFSLFIFVCLSHWKHFPPQTRLQIFYQWLAYW